MEEAQKQPKSESARNRKKPPSPQRGRRARPQRTQESGSQPVSNRAPTLLLKYRQEFVPQLINEFGYKVPLQAPRMEKVVMNVGLGEALTNSNAIDSVSQMLTAISGQKPVVTRARKSIAGFKIRDGMQIGVMVTLRGRRMYEFMERLINAALPRIRDFRGVPRTSFDGRGNYSLGIREQIIFPEIDYNRIDRIRSFQVTFVTTAQKDEEAIRLLEMFGLPFAREQID